MAIKIVCVDDSSVDLGVSMTLVRVISTGTEVEVTGFRTGPECLEFASKNTIDIAFLDINMRPMSGIELFKKLVEIHPRITIVFLTGYDDEAAQLSNAENLAKVIPKPLGSPISFVPFWKEVLQFKGK